MCSTLILFETHRKRLKLLGVKTEENTAMISHSPPIFSHSPPVSFLAEYMSNQHQNLPYQEDHNKTSIYCRPQIMTLASKAIVNNASNAPAQRALMRGNGNGVCGGRNCLDRMSSAPILPIQPKSCLSRRSTTTSSGVANTNKYSTTNSAGAPPPTNGNQTEQSKTRKKVIFADDEGLALTEVRVMSEPSNVPPYWSIKFLEQITQGLVSPQPADQWTVDFKQPASDYLTFRQTIEREFVSLENVIVRDDESIIVGTVKVKNISYQKEVVVRVTWDDWKSQQDIYCTYARAYGPVTTIAHVVFDTFSFKITLPPSSKRLEFCICYRVNNREYWDNNDNKNYTISKRSPFYYNALSPYDKNSSRNHNNQCQNLLRMSSPLNGNGPTNPAQDANGHLFTEQPTPYW